MEQQQMTEQESLRLIGEMIGKVKRSYVTKGIASIVWGVIIIICSLLTWWQVQFNFDFGFDVWLLVFVAVIPQIYFSIKEKKQRKFVAHDEDTMTLCMDLLLVSCRFYYLCYFIMAKFGNEHSTTLFYDAVWHSNIYHRRCFQI